MVKHDTLLICSNDQQYRQQLRHIFADTYHMLEAGDVRQLTLLLKQNLGYIAAVLLDICHRKEGDRLWTIWEDHASLLQKVPVIVLAQEDSPEMLHRAFSLGAVDVIPVGYDPYAMLHRVENIVDLHLHKQHLETLVEEQRRILRHTSDTMVDALSSIIEYRSVESGQHILRIRHFTRVLLNEIAKYCPEYHLTEEIIDIICSASALHDIGKIAIPDGILMKPGPLTEEEREIMKTHTLTGCRILETLEHMTDREYLRYAHNICHYHHERWDGRGYPEGLRGEAIPICAQVVSLADVYDALTSKRVYKDAFAFSKAVNMIFRGECGVFSPKLLECFKHVAHKFETLAGEYADGKIPDKEAFHTELPLPDLQSGDTIEQIQGKYFTLVHYINGLLMELDMDKKLFNLVYNPYPELAALQELDTIEDVADILCNRFVHPHNRQEMERFLEKEIPSFLSNGLRRASYRLRSRAPEPEGSLFELTLMRINPLDNTHRSLVVLAKKISPEALPQSEAFQASVPLEGTFSCQNDQYFTLLQLGSTKELLAGYTPEEIRTQFDNRLSELIHPDDRSMVRQEFTQQLKSGNEVQLEHRILMKNGTFRWVYNNSRLVTDSHGQEILFCYLVDTQNLHRDENLLQEKLQRYEMILAQTENVLFEWDMIHDTIRFSDTWEQIFGYQLPEKDCLWSQHWMDSLYPDDMPLLSDCIHNIKNGSDYEKTEVRIATARGRYLWCRFRATSIRDARGNLEKISGIIINIDSEKQAEQALQSRAEQDPLTKLLNKDAARKQSEAYFSRHPQETSGALLVIDLDNFKQINDQKGHLFGDSVLVKVSQEIQKLFRGQDIVARIGGDEFLVVMRGIADQPLLEQRCQKLIQNITGTFRSYNLQLSCSIGIALAPQHGQSYYELFQHADQALYRVKARGKGSYAIYNPQDTGYLNQPGRTAVVSNPIDSNSEPGLANDTIVRYAFRKLYSTQDTDSSIRELLAFIGEKIKVSRVYVFENSDDNRFCSNTYEWCKQGVAPEIHNLQNISYEDDIPGYADNFDEQGIFYCPDVAILPKNIYDIVAPQGIKAMLHCAIRENGVFRGYIGFDDCEEPRLWTREQIDLLTFFSEALSTFLLHHRRQEKVQQQAEELRFILDNQDSWIYVVDPNTHTLRHINSQLLKKYPHAQPGMTCYQVLENRETPCDHCPLQMLSCKNNHTSLLSSKGPSILLEATRIRWSGEDACLISVRKIPETGI